MTTWRMGSDSGITGVSKVLSVCGWGHIYPMCFTTIDANTDNFSIDIAVIGYTNGVLNFCCLYF